AAVAGARFVVCLFSAVGLRLPGGRRVGDSARLRPGRLMDRSLGEYVRLYWRLVAARGRAQLQYKLSFVLLVIGSALNLLVDLGEILVFFRFIRTFAGWTLP